MTPRHAWRMPWSLPVCGFDSCGCAPGHDVHSAKLGSERGFISQDPKAALLPYIFDVGLVIRLQGRGYELQMTLRAVG